MDGKAVDPVQVFEEDDPAHGGVDHGRQDQRRPTAEVHAGDDHVEEEEEEEGVPRQVGEIDQERQGGQVENGLEEDVVLRVDLAGGRVGLVPKEGQVIAEHGQGDEVQRQRLRHDVQDRGCDPDHEEDHRAGDPAQRDEPAGTFRGEFHLRLRCGKAWYGASILHSTSFSEDYSEAIRKTGKQAVGCGRVQRRPTTIFGIWSWDFVALDHTLR